MPPTPVPSLEMKKGKKKKSKKVTKNIDGPDYGRRQEQ
jgi:hypothetical protein